MAEIAVHTTDRAAAAEISASSSSTIALISSNGGEGILAGGSAGSVVFDSASLNINGMSVYAVGGTSGGGSSGTDGTLTFDYTTIRYSNLTLSALSGVIFNDRNNLPGNLGPFAGGVYPVSAMATLSSGAINTCGRIRSAGTYTLSSDLAINGTCITVNSSGAIINGGNDGSGGHYAITGNVDGDGTSAGSSGFDFTLQNVDVFGTTSLNGAGDDGSCDTGGGNGGNIVMSNASSTVVTANAGNLGYIGCTGGNGGSVIFSGTNVDLSNNTMSVAGGYGSGAVSGTITVNFADTLNVIGLHISALSNLTLNSPLNTPGSLGASDGGIIGALPGGTVSNSSQCNLALAGTYTLGSTINGDCNITADGIVLNGAGNTITGQVNGAGLNPYEYSFTNGHSFTLENVIVTGTTTSAGLYGPDGDIMDVNGCRIGDDALSGGSIIIIDSTTTSMITDGSVAGDYYMHQCGSNGSAGNVYAIDSKFSSISSIGGNDPIVNIFGSTLDLSSVSVNFNSFPYGILNINYDNLISNGSTVFRHAWPLTVNGFSLGYWDGIYNPSAGVYFNDKNTLDGNWNDPANWWNDAAFTILSGIVPTGLSQYIASSSVTQNTGDSPVTADTVTFNNSSINAIDIRANKVIFNDTSRNMGTILGGLAIFNGNQSENDATVPLFVLTPHESNQA